jgi:predicted dehydrogenase
MLRVAVVGYGYWGSKHVRVLETTPEVAVTIVDTDRARLAQAQQAFPAAQTAPRLGDVLTHVDAVVVATPPRTHPGIAYEALRAGRHVLVEKPLATSSPECHALIDRADDAGVVLMVGHTFEYNAAVRKLGELVDTGELGEICYIDSARLNLGLYQRDVNVIWDLAPHDISIINFLLRSSPITVSAWGHPHAATVLEDVAYLRLRYHDSGPSAYIHVSWLDPCKVRRVTVVGTRKMAVYDDMASTERLRVYDTGVTPSIEADAMHTMPMSYRYGDIVSPYIPFEEPLAVQDAHFIQCIRDGAAPRTPGQSGLEVVRVLEAASDALARGREVELAPCGSLGASRPTHHARRPRRAHTPGYAEVDA